MSQTPHQAALADVLPLIESLELPYLESLQQLLAGHIAKRREEAISEARARIMKIALSVGMSPEALLAMETAPRRPFPGAGVPKYRDPESGKTWSGLGTVPRWIKDKDRSQFLIGDSA
jgi:DNA-binding protein H-NS